MEKEKKFYSLQFIKEVKQVETINEVNHYLKDNWLLLQVTTNQENKTFSFLIGRID